MKIVRGNSVEIPRLSRAELTEGHVYRDANAPKGYDLYMAIGSAYSNVNMVNLRTGTAFSGGSYKWIAVDVELVVKE